MREINIDWVWLGRRKLLEDEDTDSDTPKFFGISY